MMIAFSQACGFDKWSISIDENMVININFSHYPVIGGINLFDVSIKELRKLSKMFLTAARHFENPKEKEINEGN